MKQSGFSLLEVLIASFIMFIALAVFTLVFRGALLSSDKATHSLAVSTYAGIVIENISSDLAGKHDQDTARGEGMLFNLHYEWRARVIKSTHPPARYFGEERIQPEHQAKIWQVEMQFKGIDKKYVFEELTL